MPSVKLGMLMASTLVMIVFDTPVENLRGRIRATSRGF